MPTAFLCEGQNSNKTPNSYSRKSKKNDLEMKRQELLSTCINVLKEPAPSQQAALQYNVHFPYMWLKNFPNLTK